MKNKKMSETGKKLKILQKAKKKKKKLTRNGKKEGKIKDLNNIRKLQINFTWIIFSKNELNLHVPDPDKNRISQL